MADHKGVGRIFFYQLVITVEMLWTVMVMEAVVVYWLLFVPMACRVSW